MNNELLLSFNTTIVLSPLVNFNHIALFVKNDNFENEFGYNTDVQNESFDLFKEENPRTKIKYLYLKDRVSDTTKSLSGFFYVNILNETKEVDRKILFSFKNISVLHDG